MKRLLPHPLLTLTLAVLWLLLVNTFSAGHVVLGAAARLADSVRHRVASGRSGPHPPSRRRCCATSSYSSCRHRRRQLPRRAADPRPASSLRPVFVTCRWHLKTDLAISLLANTISLTPGTVSVLLSEDRAR